MKLSSQVDSSSPSLRGALEHVPRCSHLRSSLVTQELVLMLRGRQLTLRTRQVGRQAVESEVIFVFAGSH